MTLATKINYLCCIILFVFPFSMNDLIVTRLTHRCREFRGVANQVHYHRPLSFYFVGRACLYTHLYVKGDNYKVYWGGGGNQKFSI